VVRDIDHSRFTEEIKQNAEETVLIKERCSYGWKGSKVSEETSLIITAWAVPHHEWRQVGYQLLFSIFRHPRLPRVSQICAGWMPNELVEEHKRERVETCIQIYALRTCKQTSKHGMEKHVITQHQDIQKRAICQQGDDDVILALQ
jgi:hypothetical protein